VTAPTGAALAPLRERYTHWLGLDEAAVLADRDEAAEDIRAMQLVLRLERGEPPSWHGAVAAAANAAALICLDPRSEPGGEWFAAVAAYCRGHIRKVTRRGRAGQWDAVGELPSVLVERAGAQVRAVLPGPVADLDKRIAKLQVGGTDAPVDAALPDLPAPVLQVWIPPEPVMTLGKTMAQAGHAGMIAAALLAGGDPAGLASWVAAGCPAQAQRVVPDVWAALLAATTEPAEAWDDGLLVVRDAGFTEIAAGTITVIAHAPRSV
jgi:peptidyl-tRNA hydrolase